MTAAIPNVLTASRLLAVPALIIVMLADAGANGPLRWWAVAVFLVAALTDFLDGYLARRWRVVSAFGELADPIADKALILTAFVLLVWVDGVPWWPVAVLAVREVAVTLGRLAVASDAVIPASRGGKLKTVLQLLAVTLYLLPVTATWVADAAWWVLLTAVAVALVTGVTYGSRIVKVWRQIRAHADGVTLDLPVETHGE